MNEETGLVIKLCGLNIINYYSFFFFSIFADLILICLQQYTRATGNIPNYNNYPYYNTFNFE